PLLVCAVGRPHSYYSKGSFYSIMIDISLFSNHSPSEWFSEHKKASPMAGLRGCTSPFLLGYMKTPPVVLLGGVFFLI
ncbi:MAG TPA: hypothetical protein H9698_10085, partial [Candidatus Ruthenibacterium merdavium]|nr:hypothetical protein [Candidatus Ruthenibacterium merdavium]